MDQNAYFFSKQFQPFAEYPHKESFDCFNCWKDYENTARDKIKLKNPKYCWLYPKHERKELNAIKPNFQYLKTLYTTCDYRLEQCVHEIILRLENEFKEHNVLQEQELKLQNELLDDIWVNSQKYLILTRCGGCVKIYPEIISAPTEKIILRNIHIKLRRVHESNYQITKSLEDIRTTMAELKCHCDRLDYTVESPFIWGSHYMRPLKYYLDLMTDLFNYFYQHLCQLKCWAELLDPGDSVAIEDYMALIKPRNDYENNLNEYLNHCHCMRSKRKECIKKHMPC